jgi:hypothetical protein
MARDLPNKAYMLPCTHVKGCFFYEGMYLLNLITMKVIIIRGNYRVQGSLPLFME